MELLENDCLICKKFTSVLSIKDSNLYFRSLNRYIFAENLNDLEFRKIFLEMHLCTECAFNIDTLYTFINNIIVRDIQSTTSDIQCNFCQEVVDCLYTSKDLVDFYENVRQFVKMVLKKVNLDIPWKICVKCCFCIKYWIFIKEFVQKSIVNGYNGEEIINYEKCDSKMCSAKTKNSKASTKSIKTEQKQSVDSWKRDLCEKSTNNDCLPDEVLFNITLPSIIKSKFNNLKIKTYPNNARSVTKQLKHLKNVGDLTLQGFRKLTQEIVSNKQLMIEKPYVKLKRLNLDNIYCTVCHQYFTTKSETRLHKLKHDSISSEIDLPNRKESDIVDVMNKYLPSLKLYKTNKHPGRNKTKLNNSVIQTPKILLDFTEKSPSNVSLSNAKLPLQNGPVDSGSMFDLSEMLEVVYSDDETNDSPINSSVNVPKQTNILTSDEVITIDSEDDNSITAENANDIVDKMHAYACKPMGNNLLGTIRENYQGVFSKFVDNRVPRSSTSNNSVLCSLLSENLTNNTQSTENTPEQQPSIRVRNDLF